MATMVTNVTPKIVTLSLDIYELNALLGKMDGAKLTDSDQETILELYYELRMARAQMEQVA